MRTSLQERLEWAASFSVSEAVSYGAFQELSGYVGYMTRRHRGVGSTELGGHSIVRHRFNPVQLGSLTVRLSESVVRGVNVPATHPEASDVRYTQVTPRLEVYDGLTSRLDLRRPTLLLAEAGPILLDVGVVLDGDMTALQEAQSKYAEYLEMAMIASRGNGQ